MLVSLPYFNERAPGRSYFSCRCPHRASAASCRARAKLKYQVLTRCYFVVIR